LTAMTGAGAGGFTIGIAIPVVAGARERSLFRATVFVFDELFVGVAILIPPMRRNLRYSSLRFRSRDPSFSGCEAYQ